MASSRSMSGAEVVARLDLADEAHRARPVALDHLAVVALGDLAHLVVELDLLDRLEHQLLLALELARAPARAARRARQRTSARVSGSITRHSASPGQRQRHAAERDHDERRAKVHPLDQATP